MSRNDSNPKKQETSKETGKLWPSIVPEPAETDRADSDHPPKAEVSSPTAQPEDPAARDPFADLVGSGGSDAAFSKADADSRTGNFVVPFGLHLSGKTTFLAALFKYIDEHENLTSRIVIPKRGKVRNYAGQAMLNQWELYT